MKSDQVIALLPHELNGEFAPSTRYDDFLLHGATALLRDEQGRMSLQSVAPDKGFLERIMTTGCFRRGQPIVDPVSREVMGYEMEMMAAPGGLRQRFVVA